MDLRNHRVKIFFIIFVFIFLAFKLFTTEVRLTDDPASILVLRSFPSLENSIILLNPENLKDYHVLIFDENGFVGQEVYHFITRYLWWLYPLLGLVFYFYKILKKH